VTVVGELDAHTVPGLEAALAPVVSGRPPRLAVDVSGVEFVDSSGIALWVRWSNLVDRLEIRDPSPVLRSALVRLGLAHRLLPIPDGSVEPAESKGAGRRERLGRLRTGGRPDEGRQRESTTSGGSRAV
jgi:anti-sigma B factor antagonist